jgi:peptide/nickel transport system ATP-binding protein
MLHVRDLGVAFGAVQPLSGVSFSVGKGETLGIVGESGSGKSPDGDERHGPFAAARRAYHGGSMAFDGQDLTTLAERAYRKLRGGRIGLITQNPMTSLDPLKKIGPQVDDVAKLHLGMNAGQARARTVDILGTLRIPEPPLICERYPHQMSGGMKQRIVIAMALAADPDVLIADEPTTALDVTVQAQIIRLLDDLVKQRDLALVLITHDMSVVAQTCDKVVVMYAGRAVEHGPVEAIFRPPAHPYTQALIACIPRGLEEARADRDRGDGAHRRELSQGLPVPSPVRRAEPICSTDAPAFSVNRRQRSGLPFRGGCRCPICLKSAT